MLFRSLELALLNVALNARDAMPNGGKVTITAHAHSQPANEPNVPLPPGDYIRIVITDDGIGMNNQTLAKATEPFFTTKGPGKGTGLGLSMVHGLAAQSGGRLLIDSEPNRGTTLELWLPVAKTVPAPAVPDTQVQKPAPRIGACRALPGPRRLVRAGRQRHHSHSPGRSRIGVVPAAQSH